MRIDRELNQLGALRQVVASHVGVVAEDLSADHDDEIVTLQHLIDLGDGHRHRACVQRVILGERRPIGQGAAVDGCAQLLGEGDACVPAAGPVDLGPEHQQRPLRPVDPVGELAEPLGVGGGALADGPHHRRTECRLLPVVERDRQVHRSFGSCMATA